MKTAGPYGPAVFPDGLMLPVTVTEAGFQKANYAAGPQPHDRSEVELRLQPAASGNISARFKGFGAAAEW
jgi:hypothetical protein